MFDKYEDHNRNYNRNDKIDIINNIQCPTCAQQNKQHSDGYLRKTVEDYNKNKNSISPKRRKIQNLTKSLYEKKPLEDDDEEYPNSIDSEQRNLLMEDLGTISNQKKLKQL